VRTPFALVIALTLLPAGAHGDARTTVKTARTTAVERAPDDPAPHRGPELAPVTIEVFCTYVHIQCAQLDTILAALSQRHPDRLRVVYRQLPLQYRDSQIYAEAALEAAAQGRFFEFHEAVNGQWATGTPTRRHLDALAERAGLELEPFRAALADGRHRARIDEEGKRKDLFEIRAPPAVVWNGRLVTTPFELERFEEIYDQTYAEARDLLATGVELRRLYPLLLRAAADERARARRPKGDAVAPSDIDVRAPRVRVSDEGAPSRGPDEADVTIVMFGDFECRFCRNMLEPLRRLDELFPGRIRVVFKHYPLPHHAQARLAAEAAQCAALQGRFWEYHDTLYKNARALSRDQLIKHARDLGLDADRFVRDLDGKVCAAAIDRDKKHADALDVEATPTLFVNGLKIVGQRSLSDLKSVVEDELRPGLLEKVTSEPAEP
jgi:protein-disulfide isomerase